jgi:hypothetical protein
MATCPVCSDVLLRHIRNGQTYWLCRRCRSEIQEIHVSQGLPLSYAKDILCSSLLYPSKVMVSEDPTPVLPRP